MNKNKKHNLLRTDFKLRPYQTQSIDLMLSRLESNRFALCVLDVGLGKSWVMVGIAEHYKRVVVLQPCLELVEQNHSKLNGAGMDTAMIDSVHGSTGWDSEFIYTTPQTLAKHLDDCAEPDLLIIDEANVGHQQGLFTKIFARWKTCKVAGFTATPHYYQRKSVYSGGWLCQQTKTISLEDVYGSAVIKITREQGQAMGYSPKIYMRKVGIPVCNAEHIANPVVYKSLINKHLRGVSDLCKTLKNGIIFCDSKSHAELLSETFNIPTIFGDTPKKVRVDRVKRFCAGRIPFLITVGCLVRGFDRQDLENIVLLTNFRNSSEAQQVIGRLSRGTCQKTCWYNGVVNTKEPVVGQIELVKIKRI